jgi:HTH-type transcriptional regulator, competence development regulator
MGQTALGAVLEHLRELRGFSLRDLADLSKVDHAYIYRLEKGEKESPSDEVLSRLIRPLKAPTRDAQMLRYLAEHTDTDPGLAKHVVSDPTISFEVFAMVAGAAHRGTKPDYAKLIARARAILDDENALG